jgi:hypothetical protein
MTNPKLALIPSGYKATKVYSILPSDGGGDFTFDRANGYASRVREDGLIEEVSNDTPRLDYLDGGCPSLLLEPSRTNLITYSENFSQSVWSKQNVTISSNSAISPDGSLNSDLLQETSANSIHYCREVLTVTSGVEFTVSFFAKKKDYDYIQYSRTVDGSSYANFNIANGTIGNNSGADILNHQIEDYGNGWYRCIANITTSSTSSGFGITLIQNDVTSRYESYLGDDSRGTYIYGAQVEQGSYATSYIKSNSGSTTTRFKDECINAGDNDLFDITEGTFFVDANNFGTPYLNFSMITLSDGSSNFVRFIYESSRIRTSVENGSIQQDYFITGVNDNERNKVAITFKENEFKTYLNGVLKDTDPSGVVPTNLDRLNFASQSGTSRHFEGKVYDTRVYDRVLTEAEAIELTTL